MTEFAHPLEVPPSHNDEERFYTMLVERIQALEDQVHDLKMGMNAIHNSNDEAFDND